ncbi:MAG: hypothetical protein WBF06_10795 [Candidatus Acidiferrales bacterium]
MIAVAVLAASAASAPVPTASMGSIVQANNASLNGLPAVNRATISSGDTLATENAGALRAQLGSSQIYLFANSSVSVNHTASGFSADLASGSVLLSSGAGQTYQVLADGAVVQPKSNQKSVAQISWVSPTELMLTSRQGDLEVTMGAETQTVNEGSSYRMMIAPASQPGASPAGQPASPSGGGSSAFYLVAISVVAAGTGVALWRAFESTSSTN